MIFSYFGKMDMCAYFGITLMILLVVFRPSFQITFDDSLNYSPNVLRYSSSFLKSLRPLANVNNALVNSIPTNLKPRKRGRRGGIRVRFRKRPFTPPLPSMIIGNARSIVNKIDELTGNVRFLSEYREAGIICVTETWLTEHTTDQCVGIDGFSLFRGDRSNESGKSRGGGVCAYVNSRGVQNTIYTKHTNCAHPTLNF